MQRMQNFILRIYIYRTRVDEKLRVRFACSEKQDAELKQEDFFMIKAVIFDLDGLLAHTEIISYQLYQDLLAPYGHSFSIEDYTQNYSGKTAVGNMRTIIERFGLPICVEEGLEFTARAEEDYFRKGVELKKGAKELLGYLKEKKYQVMLASSSTRERALKVLRQHRLDRFFDGMVFGPEVERGKPYPDIFLKACEKAGEDPADCLVLEDSEAGIQASHAAHIRVLCIPDMKVPEKRYQEMAEAVLPSLLEVISFLEKSNSGGLTF